MKIYSKLLFGAAIFGAILEGVEVWQGVCAVWQQEFLLLAALLLASLIGRGHEILIVLTAFGVIVFYGFEAYEIFVEGARCGPFASELNPLLAINLLALAALALGSQLNDEHKSS